MPEPVPAEARTLKNRILLILLLASFVLPFAVGDLAYKYGWYQGGKTNRGELINPPLAFAGLSARDLKGNPLPADAIKTKWWLVYVLPTECEAACRNRFFQMRQIRRASGKHSDRISQLLVQTAPLSAETEALIAGEFPDFLRLQAKAATVDNVFAAVAAKASVAGHLYVMDPMGWMMLFYPPEPDEKTSVIKAEDVLKDLLKLLKDSRIG